MKQISMVMTVVLALTLLATTPKAGTLKHIQVTTEDISQSTVFAGNVKLSEGCGVYLPASSDP
jgi:hypothetical protein